MPMQSVYERPTLDSDLLVQATIYTLTPGIPPHQTIVTRKIVDLWIVQKYVQYMDDECERFIPWHAIDSIVLRPETS